MSRNHIAKYFLGRQTDEISTHRNSEDARLFKKGCQRYPGEEETVERVSLPWERRQSVSVTIDNSYCDWCIAQLASELNYEEDHKLFLNRADNYKNVFQRT